jgi:hypothetical protein
MPRTQYRLLLSSGLAHLSRGIVLAYISTDERAWLKQLSTKVVTIAAKHAIMEVDLLLLRQRQPTSGERLPLFLFVPRLHLLEDDR